MWTELSMILVLIVHVIYNVVSFLIPQYLQGGFEDFVKLEQRDELRSFFVENPCPIQRKIDQTLENIEINHSHLNRDGERLRQFFNEY